MTWLIGLIYLIGLVVFIRQMLYAISEDTYSSQREMRFKVMWEVTFTLLWPMALALLGIKQFIEDCVCYKTTIHDIKSLMLKYKNLPKRK